jgi:predicted dehydrogenase
VLNIAVVGVGHWGPNLIRNFHHLSDVRLAGMCDLDESRLARFRPRYPWCEFTTRYGDLIEDDSIHAVVIATSASTHFEIARDALLAGKDVFVEKPMCLRLDHAEELVSLARQQGRILMVGHLMKYHPAVKYLKRYLDSGKLGEPLYIHSQRLNLGEVRRDENAMWCLATHDISLVGYLLGKPPYEVMAVGQSFLRRPVQDTVFLLMRYEGPVLAHVHVSWLDPNKVRRTTVVGSTQMAVFDDMEPMEKLRIYDKGIEFPNGDYPSPDAALSLRVGDIFTPSLEPQEPLRVECQHFARCVQMREQPMTDGYEGLEVVRVLEAAERSLNLSGVPVPVNGVAVPAEDGSARH